jgi:hypothetical protein
VREALQKWVTLVAQRADFCHVGRRFPVGLYLSAEAVEELRQPGALIDFRGFLDDHQLFVLTLNCFPYGGFHRSRVKEQVFRPTWKEEARRTYTEAAAEVLAGLVPPGIPAAISTVAGGAKAWGNSDSDHQQMAANLGTVVASLHELERRTGCEVVLSLEPEPHTTLETTAEVIQFFTHHVLCGVAREVLEKQGHSRSSAEDLLRRHLGLCFDTCHQAVEFEDLPDSLDQLEAAGIRIGKIQLSNALRVPRPGQDSELLAALREYDEPRYLHQAFMRAPGGEISSVLDLPDYLLQAKDQWKDAEEVRVHFHVPVDRNKLGPLQTTQQDLLAALKRSQERLLTRTLEVETYTFGVLPGLEKDRFDLVEALSAELSWAQRMRASVGVLGD